MAEPSLALQRAIAAALTGTTGAGNHVYDRVKVAGDPFPRITIGGGQTVEDDTDCFRAWEVYMDVNVWSKAIGYPEVKTIAGEAYAALHEQNLAVGDDFALSDIRVEGTVFSREPDGEISRARLSVKAYLEAS